MSNTRPVAVSPVWLTWDGDRVVIGYCKAPIGGLTVFRAGDRQHLLTFRRAKPCR
jgi:hypothetical protein